MRILALAAWWPEPANNGSRLRINRLIRALAQENDVHLLALAQEPVTAAQRRRMADVCASVQAVEQRVYTPRARDLIGSLWRSEPASVRATYHPQFAAAVRARARAIRPDLVVAFETTVAPYATLVAGVPRLLEEAEVTVLWEQFARATQPRQRVRYWLTWAKHRSYLARMLHDFDACTVVSEQERQHVQRLAPRVAVTVLPNGADIAAQTVGRAPEPDTLIYPGALSYHANRDAVTHFLAASFPLIKHHRPQVKLRITGQATAADRAALERDGVELTGYVPDVQPLITQTWSEVVPLRVGGGTRLKVLEALALGTPVVSTSKGIEGLCVRDGQHVLVANTPRAFAHATLCLLDQPRLRAHLAAHGRYLIRTTYDWQQIGGTLRQLAADVVHRHRR